MVIKDRKKKTRMNQFKKYLIEHNNRLIPPVILSARGQWVFEETNDSLVGNLKLEGKAAIVDGQHRVGGIVAHYEQTQGAISFDFICFENLSLEDEKAEFKTINGKQVGVPKALQEFLGDDPNAAIAWSLNTEDDSPFYDRISRTTLGKQHLFALHSVAKNVGRTFNHGSFENLNVDEKVSILIEYWNCVKEANPIPWEDASKETKKEHKYKLLELTGNIAWSIVGPQILIKGYNANNQDFDWDKIKEVIKFVSEDIDWEKEGHFFGMTGEVGGKQIARELEKALSYF